MADLVSLQTSLVKGEVAPGLWGREDVPITHEGASTCRNFVVSYRGGVFSRAGLAYVGTCKQQYPVPPRDIPFQFNIEQGFVLEFGDQYMRVKSDGAYVVESSVNVTGVSSTAVFTAPGHGYSVGDWVYDTGNTGFNGLTWIIRGVTTNTFIVSDLFGNSVTTATASGAGTVQRVYTAVAPYAAVDLPFLKYTQSADVMSLTLVNQDTNFEYIPYTLTRHSNTNWTFTPKTFAATIQPPTGLTVVAHASDVPSTWYAYVVTAVSSKTGEESIASLIASVENNDISVSQGSNLLSWQPVDGADSYNVYLAPASYQVGVPPSSIFGFIGTALAPSFTDDNITPDFTIVPPVHNDPFARGVITEVKPTAGGINYDNTTISYTITTSTGVGFSGRPLVSNGSLNGFIIDNPGFGYQAGDTITFSDSGGGVATGNYQGTTNHADGDTIDFNGVPITFRRSSAAPAYLEVTLGNTVALTFQNLSNYLNASTNVSLSVATYTYDATHLYITYKTPGAVGNAYVLGTGGVWTASGATLTGGGVVGSGATATLIVGAETGTYPAVSAFFSQRQVFANTLNQPDTYWMTQPGLYNNMDSSIPVTDGDSITGTPWAQQVNGIQFLQPMPGGLVVFTGKGAWQVNGGSSAAITPSDQTATPQAYNGCNNKVPPFPINYDILYVQSKGSIVRDLAYNFFTNIYTGTDLTIFSNHLFSNKQIVQWAYAEEPYKLVWAVLNDGTMLCMTYLKEQEVTSWTRHDTNGLFVSVVSVTELPVDAVYVITQRFINGAWRYYSERMNNRLWENVEDSFCVDSGISTAGFEPAGILSASASTGTNVTFTSTATPFNSGNVGAILRTGGGKATITGFNSSSQLVGTVTEPITAVIPDNTSLLPLPQAQGNWSLASNLTVFNGLNHLEGQTVSILADGSVVPSQVVTNGQITLAEPASLVTIGLQYVCQVQTLYADHQENQTVQNKRKNISAVGLRLEASRGLTVGADQVDASTQQNGASVPWTNMNEIKERSMFVNAGTAVPLYTGDYYKAITSGWSVHGQVAVQQTYPLPATILALILYWNVGDDR